MGEARPLKLEPRLHHLWEEGLEEADKGLREGEEEGGAGHQVHVCVAATGESGTAAALRVQRLTGGRARLGEISAACAGVRESMRERRVCVRLQDEWQVEDESRPGEGGVQLLVRLGRGGQACEAAPGGVRSPWREGEAAVAAAAAGAPFANCGSGALRVPVMSFAKMTLHRRPVRSEAALTTR